MDQLDLIIQFVKDSGLVCENQNCILYIRINWKINFCGSSWSSSKNHLVRDKSAERFVVCTEISTAPCREEMEDGRGRYLDHTQQVSAQWVNPASLQSWGNLSLRLSGLFWTWNWPISFNIYLEMWMRLRIKSAMQNHKCIAVWPVPMCCVYICVYITCVLT